MNKQNKIPFRLKLGVILKGQDTLVFHRQSKI